MFWQCGIRSKVHFPTSTYFSRTKINENLLREKSAESCKTFFLKWRFIFCFYIYDHRCLHLRCKTTIDAQYLRLKVGGSLSILAKLFWGGTWGCMKICGALMSCSLESLSQSLLKNTGYIRSPPPVCILNTTWYLLLQMNFEYKILSTLLLDFNFKKVIFYVK